MVGVAVKVTDVPVQMVVLLAAMLTDGVTAALTVMVIPVLVAVVGLAHAALLVITQVIASLLAKVALV